MELFITPKQNITDTSSLEWQYFVNLTRDDIRQRWKQPIGKGLLNTLLSGRFSRDTLEETVGKLGGKYDLRGICLSNINLSGVDFSQIDFFYADLSDASLERCNFSGSYLSECNISGTSFDWAKLENVFLDNVEFNNQTSFLGVDLHIINFTLATLLYDLALSQQRIKQLEKHHKYFARFLRVSCDYGRSFFRYAVWVTVFLLIYAAAYWGLMGKPFVDCLYFSIATFATVGYGDILPVTIFEKILVMSEIGIGYLMGGLLVGILAKRVIG